jgi:hypothetical protein
MPKSEPLNTIPVQQFLQQVKTADASKQREIRLTIDQAKNLAFTLGIVMSRLEGDLEKLVSENASSDNEQIEVRLDGGSGWK